MKTTITPESQVYICLICFFVLHLESWLRLIFLCCNRFSTFAIPDIVKILLYLFLHILSLYVTRDSNDRIFVKIVIFKIFNQICVAHVVYILFGSTYIPTQRLVAIHKHLKNFTNATRRIIKI